MLSSTTHRPSRSSLLRIAFLWPVLLLLFVSFQGAQGNSMEARVSGLLRGGIGNVRGLFDLPSPFQFNSDACLSKCHGHGEEELTPFLNVCPKCPDRYSEEHCNHCCLDGASSLKLRWHGCPSGTFSFASDSDGNQDCDLDPDDFDAYPGASVQFIDCECYDIIANTENFAPFGCNTSAVWDVTPSNAPFADICIVSVLPTGEIDFSLALPPIVGIVHTSSDDEDDTHPYLLTNDTDWNPYPMTTYFDTTCDFVDGADFVLPIFAGFGKFPNSCANESYIDLEEHGNPRLPEDIDHYNGEPPPNAFWFEFLDGTSTSFWPSNVTNLKYHYFDPTFARCSCTDCHTSAPSPYAPENPTSAPTEEPSQFPSVETAVPTDAPTASPTHPPSDQPSSTPTTPPSQGPTVQPTPGPTPSPTDATEEPTNNPTVSPTYSSLEPSGEPSPEPSEGPTETPTLSLSPEPSSSPSVATNEPSESPTEPFPAPTPSPTHSPTLGPSPAPSAATSQPSESPSTAPSYGPSVAPQVGSPEPSNGPTFFPTGVPIVEPSFAPHGDTAEPSVATEIPTSTPTLAIPEEPTTAPSVQTSQPTKSPTLTPSSSPSEAPSVSPVVQTLEPTGGSTSLPTSSPTPNPSPFPSRATPEPSETPSVPPSIETFQPTESPTAIPSYGPSEEPSGSPTIETLEPSDRPTVPPTQKPSPEPSFSPSVATAEPSTEPSRGPTGIPTSTPSFEPSAFPTIGKHAPTHAPTQITTPTPSQLPTLSPSTFPFGSNPQPPAVPSTAVPSIEPSLEPSTSPTKLQPYVTHEPTECGPHGPPSMGGTTPPSRSPSSYPSAIPSTGPTEIPTSTPSLVPSSEPDSNQPGPPGGTCEERHYANCNSFALLRCRTKATDSFCFYTDPGTRKLNSLTNILSKISGDETASMSPLLAMTEADESLSKEWISMEILRHQSFLDILREDPVGV